MSAQHLWSSRKCIFLRSRQRSVRNHDVHLLLKNRSTAVEQHYPANSVGGPGGAEAKEKGRFSWKAESVSDISPLFKTVAWSANFCRNFSEFASLVRLQQASIALQQDSNQPGRTTASLQPIPTSEEIKGEDPGCSLCILIFSSFSSLIWARKNKNARMHFVHPRLLMLQYTDLNTFNELRLKK